MFGAFQHETSTRHRFERLAIFVQSQPAQAERLVASQVGLATMKQLRTIGFWAEIWSALKVFLLNIILFKASLKHYGKNFPEAVR